MVITLWLPRNIEKFLGHKDDFGFSGLAWKSYQIFDAIKTTSL